jgi:hypothetical protein
MLQIVMRQQNLGDVQRKFAEQFFVSRHQSRLANGGARLRFGKFSRTFRVAKNAHSRADRARSHDDNFLAFFAQRRGLRYELFHLREVRLFFAVGENARAEFDDNSTDIFQ